MHIGNHYKFLEFILWTRRDIYKLILFASIPTAVYQFFHLTWLAIPWVPVALMGTAAAFIVGFKNTQTYNRLWEARQIWGSIVNTSRSLGVMVVNFVHADAREHRKIIYRHMAWLTALRHQLRKPQPWENMSLPQNREYRKFYSIPEWEIALESELPLFLERDEMEAVLKTKNRAAQLNAHQASAFTKLRAKRKIDEYAYVELMRRLADLYDHQGRAERIKNFPYPRQFASMNKVFVWAFVSFLPFGLLGEFNKLGPNFVWLTIPFSVIVSWIFTSIDRVGQSTENPFEGGANDIPMAAMVRGIEIDLREILGETDLPEPRVAMKNILM
jgi:ion channel-forming bestrophin family protein